MASLGSYIFKPRHSEEVAGKIIERFVRDYLRWDEAAAYVYWTSPHSRKNLPDGYVEFHIESDQPDFEIFSEACFLDEELSAEELTEGLYILLGETFWHNNDEGDPVYTFEDRELYEIVNHLAEDGSRVISYGAGKEAFVSVRNSSGWASKTIDTSDFLFNVPIEFSGKNKQLTLPLA
tara:strand:- start:788 stop:1321 length:534 start_codon:yes stop_codon:yes gene_type:complete